VLWRLGQGRRRLADDGIAGKCEVADAGADDRIAGVDRIPKLHMILTPIPFADRSDIRP
jgi:hypothetical protein